ncbi:MAG: SDR family NAD(P)-dependent oxidoreductase [Actinobacteria bacterium]|nr:SDR family NAD(P)-dependent oxidoreductase [Actinomycetota bacterium]
MPKWTAADIPDQTGRTILITGANSGLGLRSAEALARAGALVIMACRNEAKAKTACDGVATAARGAPPAIVSLDLADLGSVRDAAAEVRERFGRVDVLMNNAGLMIPPLQRTAEGHELQFATNHLGHFALTGLLLPALAGPGARVVTTSSMAHRPGTIRWDDIDWNKRYSKWLAYSQSKLANLLFAFELNRRATVAGTKLASVAAHPGYAATHLQTAAGEAAGHRLKTMIMQLGNRVFAQSDAMGALPQLYAATMPDVDGGQYFGPDLFEWRGHPRLVGAARKAYDVETATRLWSLSEELTGVQYDFTAIA